MTNYATPAAPGATGDKLDFTANNGALLRIEVKGLKEAVPTQHGPADAISADVAILDGPNKAAELADVLIFPKVIVGQLKASIGQVVLGRLGQGERKPGKNPAWLLLAPTEDDVATAQKFDAYKAKQAAEEPF